jgi:hypothetical protein
MVVEPGLDKLGERDGPRFAVPRRMFDPAVVHLSAQAVKSKLSAGRQTAEGY